MPTRPYISRSHEEVCMGRFLWIKTCVILEIIRCAAIVWGFLVCSPMVIDCSPIKANWYTYRLHEAVKFCFSLENISAHRHAFWNHYSKETQSWRIATVCILMNITERSWQVVSAAFSGLILFERVAISRHLSKEVNYCVYWKWNA